ncbi:hypothetical protein McPS_33330 [Marichromatium sp. PS1]
MQSVCSDGFPGAGAGPIRDQVAAAQEQRIAERITAAQARQEAGKAREEAARLAAALLARINPAESKPASTRKKGGE